MGLVERALQYAAKRTVQTQTRMTRPVTFTNGGSTSLLQVSGEQRAWSASAIAYRCVQAISSNASSLRLQVVRTDGSEIEGHELARLWESPNPLISGRTFGEFLWQRLETRGEVFVYLDRGNTGTGKLGAMWPIFGAVEVVVDKNIAGEIVGYVVDVGGRKIGLLPSEVLWLRYPDAENEWGCMSPLAAAAHALGLDAYARAWQKAELKNGARPSAVVYLGDLDEEQHGETVAAYRSRMEGAHNAGRTLFVSSAVPAKIERMSLTPAELGWLDTRRVSWEEMFVAFGVPKDYLLGGATYENRDAARSTLWSDTIMPKVQIVSGELTRQLLGNGERVTFYTGDVQALQESADGKAKRTNGAVELDLMTLDEARASYGLPPLGGSVGDLTLTAYRALLQLEAQSLLVQADPAARQMPSIPFGPLRIQAVTSKLSLPVAANAKRGGLSFDDAQNEYDMHERVGAGAVKRLAAKQEEIVLQNLHKLFGRSGGWATKRERLESAVRDVVAARAAGDDVAAAMLELRVSGDDMLDPKRAAAMTREQLEAFLSNVWARGMQTTAAHLGIGFDVFEHDVLMKMDARLDVLAEQVTATTRDVIESRVLLVGVAEGESVDELAARVRAIFTDLSTWRATTIARTETVGGFNASSYMTAMDTGLVRRRTWLSAGDSRVRDSHVMTDGDTLDSFDQRYANGCLHPGDPTGPREETIMCRCVETYETD